MNVLLVSTCQCYDVAEKSLKLFREIMLEQYQKKLKNLKNVHRKMCKTVNDVQKKLFIVLCRY